MSLISYENIDLFYYHSIDIDFARFFSILNYGIVSKNAAFKEKIKYYYRNYSRSSNKSEYVSVNHFPRTVLRYFQIENELYDFNTNKICFVVDDINILEKQAYKNKNQYTNERHVHYKINPQEIKGILLRKIDAQKKLSEIPFNYKSTNNTYFENKVFTNINFFIDFFGTFGNTNKLYYLLGRLREAQICEQPDEIIMELISREIKNHMTFILNQTLGVNDPTLLEVISYFNNNRYPIYIMNRYDIQPVGTELSKTDWRLEKFKETTNSTVSEMKYKKSIDKKTLKLLKKMSDGGVDIYYGYSIGPLTYKDYEIAEEIKKLTLKK